VTNPTSKKAPLKKTKAIVPKAKKTALTVPKTNKAPAKANLSKKSVKKAAVLIVPVEVVVPEVVTENQRGRPINLPI
jgi:hypothetical protein